MKVFFLILGILSSAWAMEADMLGNGNELTKWQEAEPLLMLLFLPYCGYECLSEENLSYQNKLISNFKDETLGERLKEAVNTPSKRLDLAGELLLKGWQQYGPILDGGVYAGMVAKFLTYPGFIRVGTSLVQEDCGIRAQTYTVIENMAEVAAHQHLSKLLSTQDTNYGNLAGVAALTGIIKAYLNKEEGLDWFQLALWTESNKESHHLQTLYFDEELTSIKDLMSTIWNKIEEQNEELSIDLLSYWNKHKQEAIEVFKNIAYTTLYAFQQPLEWSIADAKLKTLKKRLEEWKQRRLEEQ